MHDMIEPTPAARELAFKREQSKEKEKAEQERLDELIPTPVGWSILVVMPEIEEAFDSGLIKSHETQRAEAIMSSIGLVLDMGPQAYKDQERFSSGPWCKQGDYVMFRPHSGTRFKMGKREYRLLNDDSIEAVVPDPSVVKDPR